MRANPAVSSTEWEILSPYLDRALEMSDEERSIWLSSLRIEDAALSRKLEILLQEHSGARKERFLEGKSIAMPAGLAGQSIGPYLLVSQIGQGGMGSVWLARRNDGRFERQVAVKFLSIPLIGRIVEARFRREGSILGRLTHPNIAELLDSGVTPAGQPYLVLEYVEGEHIDRYCDRHTLDIKSRVRLFLNVLGAVAHAHRNLVVHRDIKPSNVLVKRDGQVKLLDFGIAKLLAEGDHFGTDTQLTVQEGEGPMTPRYAAPEQLQGGAITTSTDVYASGLLLYVLLTGQHPVEAESSSADLLNAVVHKEATRPSLAISQNGTKAEIAEQAARRATTVEKLSHILRGDLDTIVAKALKKDPSERYPSAAALADDLRRYLKNEPIQARADSFAYKAAKFVRRHSVIVAFATLATIAILAGMVGTLLEAKKARSQRDLAIQQLLRWEAVTEFNEFLLSDAAPSGKPFSVNDLLRRAESILSQQRANSEANRTEMLIFIGDQYSTKDDDIDARRVLEEAYKLSQLLPERNIRAQAACTLAGALARDGDLTRAEALFQEGMRELPSESQYDPERILCLRRGSEVAQERGNPHDGIARVQEAQRILKASPLRTDTQELSVALELAEAYRMAGLNQEAVPQFEQANGLLASLGREDTQEAVVTFNDWALALSRLGRPLESERLYLRAISTSQTGTGEETVSPVILSNYAKTLIQLGRLKEAAQYAERSYERARQVDNQFAIYGALNTRAVVYLEQGDFQRASAMLADLEPRLRQRFEATSYWFGALASLQALLAAGTGHLQQGSDLADQSVAIIEAAIKSGGDGADFLPIALLRRCGIRLQAGRYADAAADADRALSLLQKGQSPGTFSSYIGHAYFLLGRALLGQNKQSEALAAFGKATEHLQQTLGPNHSETRMAQQAEASIRDRSYRKKV